MALFGRLTTRFFILLPALLLLLVVYYYSENIFFADDFHLLKTVVWLRDANSWQEKLELLTQQHNEHRIVVPRLITWLDYQSEGHIDWPVLMLLGSAIWCGILYFLWAAFQTFKLPAWYFFPIPWLLFQPAYYDNYTWTISVLQQSVIVFVLAWLVHAFATRRYGLAVFVVLVGTFTHGNGIFGFGVGMVFLTLFREWRWLTAWLILAVAVALCYFYGFQKGQNADFGQSLTNPGRLIAYFFAFFGAVTQIFSTLEWPAAVWGGLVFSTIGGASIFWLYANWGRDQSRYYFQNALLGNFLFLAVTALLVAISRSWSAEFLIMPPRYAHYSPYLTSWFYLLSLSVLSRTALATRLWVTGCTGLAAILWLVSYLHYLPNLANRRDWLRADAANWKQHGAFMQNLPSFNSNIAEPYLAAVARGICRPYTALPSALDEAPIDSAVVLNFEVTEFLTKETDRTLSNPFLKIEYKGYRGTTPLLALVPVQGAVVWLPFFRSRNAYAAMLKGDNIFGPEMSAEVLLENIPKGRYQFAIYTPKRTIFSRYRLAIDATGSYRLD